MNRDDGLTVRVRRDGACWVAECAAPPTAGGGRTVAEALTGLAGALTLHYGRYPVPPVVVVAGAPLVHRLAGLAWGWRRLLALDLVGTAAVVAAVVTLYQLVHGGGVTGALGLSALVVPCVLALLNVPELLLAVLRAPWNLVRRGDLAEVAG